jgi:hypothetical protein
MGYNPGVSWEVEYTDEFEQWWNILSVEEQAAIDAAVDMLAQTGPALGRPWVDTIKTSRHRNMKELRPRGGYTRILFAFDPRRTAILLIGGDKKSEWTTWYTQMVPVADQLYDDHLEELKREGKES